MRRDPEGGRALFGRLDVSALGAAGLLVGLVALAAFLTAREIAPEEAQTMTYATVALAELALVFSFRSPAVSAWCLPWNPFLAAAVLGSASLLGLTIYLPVLGDARGAVALGWAESGIVLALA